MYQQGDKMLEVRELLVKAFATAWKNSDQSTDRDTYINSSITVIDSMQVQPEMIYAEEGQGLTDGEVDVFVGTTQAAKDEVEAGTLIPILAMNDRAFEGFVTPSGPITVPTCAGDSKAPELNPANDYESCILPAGGVLAAHKGADQTFIDEMIEITKDVWNEPEFNEWIASILLNRFEVYGDEAEAFINEACEKAINAYKNLSGQA